MNATRITQAGNKLEMAKTKLSSSRMHFNHAKHDLEMAELQLRDAQEQFEQVMKEETE